jgi:hypothetical protein
MNWEAVGAIANLFAALGVIATLYRPWMTGISASNE